MADSLFSQLRKFLVETNAIALAVAVVLGGAVTKLVGVLVSAFIMPIVGVLQPGEGAWSDWTIPLVRGQAIQLGELINAGIDFLIVSLVIFFLATKVFKIEVKK